MVLPPRSGTVHGCLMAADASRLITQRSQVQILPPLPEKVQAKGLVTGNGTRPLIVLDRSLTAAGRRRTSLDVTGLTGKRTVRNGPRLRGLTRPTTRHALPTACSDLSIMDGMSESQDRLLSPGEVADLFRVDPKTVTRWARQGRLPALYTLGGHRRYRWSDIEPHLNALEPGSLIDPGLPATNSGPN